MKAIWNNVVIAESDNTEIVSNFEPKKESENS